MLQGKPPIGYCHCILYVLLHKGTRATLEFYLNDFTDVPSLQDAIRNIPYRGGWTNTTGGLWLMRTEIFNDTKGEQVIS